MDKAPRVAFAPLPPRSRAALLAIARRTRYAAGATILDEGLETQSFFLLWSGQVKMCRLTPAGKNLILSLFGPGDLFGVTAVLSGEPSTAAFETLTDTETLEIRRADLYALFARQPELMAEILPYLTRQLAECRNCLVESSCARVENRFASLFVGLADKLGQPADGGCLIPLPLSRQELADLTATTLETAIRVMSRWGRAGVVTTRRDGFVVHDRPGLEELAWAC